MSQEESVLVQEQPQTLFPHPEGFPQLLITMNPRTKKLELAGCLDDLLLCLDMLSTSETLIKNLHRESRKQSAIVAAPASVLDRLKPNG